MGPPGVRSAEMMSDINRNPEPIAGTLKFNRPDGVGARLVWAMLVAVPRSSAHAPVANELSQLGRRVGSMKSQQNLPTLSGTSGSVSIRSQNATTPSGFQNEASSV